MSSHLSPIVIFYFVFSNIHLPTLSDTLISIFSLSKNLYFVNIFNILHIFETSKTWRSLKSHYLIKNFHTIYNFHSSSQNVCIYKVKKAHKQMNYSFVYRFYKGLLKFWCNKKGRSGLPLRP